jgi:hypothetical protein
MTKENQDQHIRNLKRVTAERDTKGRIERALAIGNTPEIVNIVANYVGTLHIDVETNLLTLAEAREVVDMFNSLTESLIGFGLTDDLQFKYNERVSKMIDEYYGETRRF